ncbi:hypothetical protein [Haliangium sp.]|uniref:hypothetical protein n=1 Tax=Haliangium sp. TaxID=2663208 RepID=UPI003D0DDA1E
MFDELTEAMDPDAARKAFEALQPHLDAQEDIRRANTDLDKAVIMAAALGRMVKQPEVRARFEALPTDAFDQAYVDRLEPAALATWYVGLARKQAEVSASGGRLPSEAVRVATEVKRRMMRVVGYHLGDDAEVAAELSDIRAGTGYVDLGTDLMRLADLYEAHADELSEDSRHYQDSDADLARRLALAIHQVLGDGRDSDADYWAAYQRRAWSFLLDTYDEVSLAGRWLYRHEDAAERFPSLYTIGRRGGGGGVAEPEPEPAEPDAPAPDQPTPAPDQPAPAQG